MRNLYTIIISMTVLLTACEKTVDAGKLLDTEEKVSIISYIAPSDTLLRVNVSKALPAIGTTLSASDGEANRELFLIKDALVTMSDEEGNSTDFTYSQEEGIYTSDASNLIILGGREYVLNVTANGKNFTARCTIPREAPKIVETVRTLDNDFGGILAEIDITFEDISGERNFYVLDGFTKETFDGGFFNSPLFFESDRLITDALEDGIVLGETAIVSLGQQGNTQPIEVTLQVAHIDEIIYQNVLASNLNDENFGNPFVEYSITPNNIQGKGGVGLFAGYQVSEKVIIIEE